MPLRSAAIRSLQLAFLLVSVPALASDRTGFFLPDSIREVSITYREVNGLIVLPFIINDTISVNLVLDSGSSNIVIFGSKFSGLIDQTSRVIRFSGHGSADQSIGFVMIGSTFQLKEIRGESIPVIVVPDSHIPTGRRIDGVIGLDIFQKFEVEIDPVIKTVFFRPAMAARPARGYTLVELKIHGHRAIIHPVLTWFEKKDTVPLVIDTGSMFGLIKFTRDNLSLYSEQTIAMGSGLNGKIHGLRSSIANFDCTAFQLEDVPIQVVITKLTEHFSVGMGILKDYKILLNYAQGYAGFQKVP